MGLHEERREGPRDEKDWTFTLGQLVGEFRLFREETTSFRKVLVERMERQDKRIETLELDKAAEEPPKQFIKSFLKWSGAAAVGAVVAKVIARLQWG